MRHAAGELAERFQQLRAASRGLCLPPPRHVELAAEEVEQLSIGGEDRADEERVPEGAAIPAIVQHLQRHVGAVGDGGAEGGDAVGVRPRALHEAAVAADHLLRRVARHLLEGLVGEDDRIVGLVGVRDDHRHARHLDGREEDVVAPRNRRGGRGAWRVEAPAFVAARRLIGGGGGRRR